MRHLWACVPKTPSYVAGPVSQGGALPGGHTWAALIRGFLHSAFRGKLWKSHVRLIFKESTWNTAPNFEAGGWTRPGEHIPFPWELVEKYCAVLPRPPLPALPWLQDQAPESIRMRNREASVPTWTSVPSSRDRPSGWARGSPCGHFPQHKRPEPVPGGPKFPQGWPSVAPGQPPQSRASCWEGSLGTPSGLLSGPLLCAPERRKPFVRPRALRTSLLCASHQPVS